MPSFCAQLCYCCCCYHCMGKHSPATLKVMPSFFAVVVADGACATAAVAAVDSPIVCAFFHVFFLILSALVCALCFFPVSVLHLLVYGWETFALSRISFCVYFCCWRWQCVGGSVMECEFNLILITKRPSLLYFNCHGMLCTFGLLTASALFLCEFFSQLRPQKAQDPFTHIQECMIKLVKKIRSILSLSLNLIENDFSKFELQTSAFDFDVRWKLN